MTSTVTSYSSILSNDTYLRINRDEALPSVEYFNDTYAETAVSGHLSSGTYRDSLYVVIPVTVIYASIFFTGIVGNVSTCIVIARNKSMHTATNYYLFSLAVSDLLLLVSGLPAEMYLVWCKYPYIFGEGFCVLRGLASETSANASVLTIAAFTVERYVAICHPFLSQTLSKLSRAIKLILVIWLVALSFALPQALQFGVVRHSRHPDMVMCTVKRIIISHSFELSTFLFFVMPMCLITVLYALIGLKLRKSNMMKNMVPGRAESIRSCRHPGRSSRRVLKMLVAVVIAFFICWAPFHVQRLVAIYGTNTEDHITSNGPWMEFLYLLMTYVSGVLYYVSTTINPILYNIMSNKFRMAFMETLSKSCRHSGLRHEQRSYSSLSRSQQRTIGAYGSRTMGRGSGMIMDSMEGSGNSGHQASQKQSVVNNQPKCTNGVFNNGTSSIRNEHIGETKNNNLDVVLTTKKSNLRSTSNCGNDKWQRNSRCDKVNRSIRKNQNASLSRYKEGQLPNIDGTSKKWWRMLKWLPDLKILKFPRRRSTVPEDRVLDEFGNRREELSMTMWNIRDGTDQRPV